MRSVLLKVVMMGWIHEVKVLPSVKSGDDVDIHTMHV